MASQESGPNSALEHGVFTAAQVRAAVLRAPAGSAVVADEEQRRALAQRLAIRARRAQRPGRGAPERKTSAAGDARRARLTRLLATARRIEQLEHFTHCGVELLHASPVLARAG